MEQIAGGVASPDGKRDGTSTQREATERCDSEAGPREQSDIVFHEDSFLRGAPTNVGRGLRFIGRQNKGLRRGTQVSVRDGLHRHVMKGLLCQAGPAVTRVCGGVWTNGCQGKNIQVCGRIALSGVAKSRRKTEQPLQLFNRLQDGASPICRRSLMDPRRPRNPGNPANPWSL